MQCTRARARDLISSSLILYVFKPPAARPSHTPISQKSTLLNVFMQRFLPLRSLHFQLSPRGGGTETGQRQSSPRRVLFVRQLSLVYSYNNNKCIPSSPPTTPPHLYFIDVPFRRRPECNAYIKLYATCFRKNKNVFEYIIYFRVYIFYIIVPP